MKTIQKSVEKACDHAKNIGYGRAIIEMNDELKKEFKTNSSRRKINKVLQRMLEKFENEKSVKK